jgi:hypothetical protein
MSRLVRSVFTLALAGLLASCATSPGAGGEGSADSVSLRFAWPQGFTAQVASTISETDGTNPPERTEQLFQLKLEGEGEERELSTERLRMTGASGPIPPEVQLPPTPTLVLGPAGELKRVEGTQEALAQMFKDAESQGIPPEQRDALAKLVGEALDQSARNRWEELIGKWNGLTLRPGEVVERKGQMTMPFFGNSVETKERLSLKERVSCTEGGTEKRCVRLVLDSGIEPSSHERAGRELVQRMKQFMKANSGLPESAIPEMKVTKLQVDGSFELIAEPETLIPHRLRGAGNAIILMQDPDGETQTFKLQNERSEVFTQATR